MRRAKQVAGTLADRLCRPQRIGVFGHRGVGKTTLLTMLYREAVGGRLSGLRLAAGDARTANYLSDKLLQLEAGQPLPATLAETELRFQFYHGPTRLELLFKDYQGEHIELGRQEPIREFLRDCDAVWLCLDAGTLLSPADRLQRQQEIEQMIEDYLAEEPQTTMERPAALVLTKADLLPADMDSLPAVVQTYLGMTRHALDAHCPHNGLFAVSSLRTPGHVEEGEPPIILEPRNLSEPLIWLAESLQAQDEARLERLWSLAGGDLGLMGRCVTCFVRRYPQTPAAQLHQRRLQELRRRQYQRRGVIAAVAAACLAAFLWGYDAFGYHQARRFEAEHASEPAAVLHRWQRYQVWHPTRNLLRPASAVAERRHLDELAQEARSAEYREQLAQLQQQAGDPQADAQAAWQHFQELRTRFPEAGQTEDAEPLRVRLKARRDEQLRRQGQQAFDQLVRSELEGTDLAMLVAQADQFLRDYPETPNEGDVRRRRAAYLHRLDERDIEAARTYSARQPFNFQTRREHYQRYLDKHPNGAFAAEATTALAAIETDWDKHDFRAIRDQFEAHPSDIPELVTRCRAYEAIHPAGHFTTAATALLRWSERVTTRSEYRVILRSGQFDKHIARWLSRGPSLSVELEVAGVRYGPSTIVANRYDPDWDYEFPRRIRWKLGDPVRIRVTDHKYWSRQVVEIGSEEGDPLAMRLLSGDAWSGPNRITFESDFAMPKLPKIE
jgi:hypothetical protein